MQTSHHRTLAVTSSSLSNDPGAKPGSAALVRREAPLPPGPGGISSVTNPWTAWRDPIGMFHRVTREHGSVAMLRFGPLKYVVVNDPQSIRHVLLDNAKNYTKSRNYRGIKLILGNGLLTSEGDFWRRQRKLAQPAFHRERMAAFVDAMTSATDKMFERWDAQGKGGAFETDIHEEMMAVTFHIVGLTLLSCDLLGDAASIGKALGTALYFANDYAESIVNIPLWIPTKKNRSFLNARKILDEMVFRVIAERREARRTGRQLPHTGKNAGDLLDMLMDAKDEDTGEQMSDEQLRDEVMTMVLAGHETTANALSFSLYLLSKHPDVTRRLATEVRTVLGDRTPRLEDLPKLALTKRVLEESMRLFPPAWAFERQAVERDEIKGFTIPKGAVVGVCPYVLHRDASFWENPEGFDPDRFLVDAKERAKYTYLPFGGGARVCIGNAFAMMEAQIILAKIVQKWSAELLPLTKLELDPVITLRPRDGLQMRLAPRSPSAVDSSAARGGDELVLQGGERVGCPHGVNGGRA